MKKIVASVGLVALGASGLTVASGQDTSLDTTPTPYKPWNISGSLRGFYDDNISTLSKDSGHIQRAFGYEVSPGAGVDWRTDQTTFKANYDYTFRDYDHKPYGNSTRIDQQHIFTMDLAHSFSERYQAGLADSFVIGQEPDVLRTGSQAGTTDAHYVSGNNIHNDATLSFNATLTPIFGMSLAYENSFYDYHASGAEISPDLTYAPRNIVTYSPAGTLNRVEHYVRLDGRYLLSPETTGVLEYDYTEIDYTGNELISEVGYYPPPPNPLTPTYAAAQYSNVRNSRANGVSVGLDHTFTPDLSGMVRVGVRDTDYYNQPGSSGSKVTPNARLSLTYNYAVESSASLGFSYDKNATDFASPAIHNVGTTASPIYLTSVTLDQEAAVIWGELRHRIQPNLYGDLILTYQDATFNGGAYNNSTEQYFLLGLTLQYKFNANLSADAGYNYDRVSSQVPGRDYTRNRVFIGATASY